MPSVFCYTKPGKGVRSDPHYPGHEGLLCDWEQAVHLAWSRDGKDYRPLRNNTGILFARASYEEDPESGVDKTLADPRLFRDRNGKFGLCAIRRNRNLPDSGHPGSILVYSSEDLVRYRETAFLHVSDGEVREPAIHWEPSRESYRVQWRQGDLRMEGWTEDLREIREIREDRDPPEQRKTPVPEGCDPDGILPGNCLEVTEEELCRLRKYLDEIRHVETELPEVRLPVGSSVGSEALPKARCVYSDGSVHEKKVLWDGDALKRVRIDRPGIWRIPGKIRPYPARFPIPLNYGAFSPEEINDPNMFRGMSDPCVTFYRGKYYLSSTGNQRIVLRCADRPEDVFSAEPIVIFQVPLAPDEAFCGTWAAELHEIGGSLYLLTTICPYGEWTSVQAVMLRCTGDPLDPACWEAPKWCVTAEGGLISRNGISLDMTYFEDGGSSYVMWSNRIIEDEGDRQVIRPAEIDIATVSPEKPWVLTSDPVCISRPDYGWDRYETEVDEGPYLLRSGDRLLVTISCSSTGYSDLYNVGLLSARSGTDLLDPASWDKWPYPLLTSESVPGEFGPGHNNFVRDHETGDTLMVYHAVPHGEGPLAWSRQPALRRVHMAASGLPYLEMTPERDVAPNLADVVLTLRVE